MTSFLADHPGGDDLILEYAGKDVDEVMADPSSHEHSSSAYEMLEDFRIGELGGVTMVSDGEFEGSCILTSLDWVPDENFHPDETNVSSDFEKNKFLDLSKPLLAQVWRANWSKEYYLQQVHSPRHLKESARLFGWDALEVSSWRTLMLTLGSYAYQVVCGAHDLGTDHHVPVLPLALAVDRLANHRR